MKNGITVLLASLFIFAHAYADNSVDDVQAMTQKLKGEYKNPGGKTVNLTKEQVSKLLKGESLKIEGQADVQLSKQQLEHKENITTEDMTKLLRGEKTIKKP